MRIPRPNFIYFCKKNEEVISEEIDIFHNPITLGDAHLAPPFSYPAPEGQWDFFVSSKINYSHEHEGKQMDGRRGGIPLFQLRRHPRKGHLPYALTEAFRPCRLQQGGTDGHHKEMPAA